MSALITLQDVVFGNKYIHRNLQDIVETNCVKEE